MAMTVTQAEHLPWAGHGGNTRAHGWWLWEEGGEVRNPMFSVTPLCTRENKVFANFYSDLVGSPCKDYFKKGEN